MVMSFKYKVVERPDGTIVKTPSIPITINGKTESSYDVIALLDSGADISVIPQDFAELIGLDLNQKTTVAFGIGGEVKSIEDQIEIMVKKGHEEYTFRVPVKIILGDYDFPILLGREGFFNKFLITFDQEKQKVSLKKITRGY